MKTDSATIPLSARGPRYRMIWRWHFYAGLFCMPFVLWLASTGSIYLFKPQIDHWLERPYDRLTINGPLATPSAQVAAAQIGSASCRERACQYVEIPVVAVTIQKKTKAKESVDIEIIN